jgi:hypothetical protein
MNDDDPNLNKYFNRLTREDRSALEHRIEQYGDQLRDQGYEVSIAEGTDGFFAGVLVIDSDRGRFGFLEANGSVSWLSDGAGGIGSLGSAVVQRPTEELDPDVEGLENADIE